MSDRNLPSVLAVYTFPSSALQRLKQHCNVTIHAEEKGLSTEEFLKAIPAGVEAMVVMPYYPVNKETLDTAGPQLKVVVTMSAGFDHIDLEECKRRGIKVGHSPGVLTNAVAEMTVALTLATARHFEQAFRAVKTGEWGAKWENMLLLTGKEITNSVIGIVGLGRIGLATAKRLAAFEPSRIVYCGNSPKAAAKEIQADFVSFNDLLEMSDFVIATCAINESNKGLFGAEAFKRMKKSAIFINITRGALVDQDALYDALSTNQIGAAGLDVTTPEPLPTDHKLLSLRNCIITPHLAGITFTALEAVGQLTVDNILAGLNGQPLLSSAY